MPYIDDNGRASLEDGFTPMDAGELNYELCQTLLEYLNKYGVSYLRLNDCLGALEGAKQEFYRRVVVPYEEKKIKENGDLDWPEIPS